jgi:hypothetical protein
MRVETQGMAGRSPLQTIIVGVDGGEGGRDALSRKDKRVATRRIVES